MATAQTNNQYVSRPMAQSKRDNNVSQHSALVVDDSSTSRMLLTKILKKMDIHCEQAASGEDALSTLDWYRPDFIFLDHLMPGMDGFETLQAIKNNDETNQIPVVMYTSQHTPHYYEEAHKLGASGVISKQIDRDKLYRMLNRLCSTEESPEKTEKDKTEIPIVYEEVTSGITKAVSNASNSLLFARISTLETAYEEMHDELRSTRLELTQTQVHYEALKKRSSRISIPTLISIVLMVLVIAGIAQVKVQMNAIERSQIEQNEQNKATNQVIDNILDTVKVDP